MQKAQIIDVLDKARRSLGLSKAGLAEAVGLNRKSGFAALSLAGNPQLSTLLAIVDYLGLEIEIVPKGFGSPSRADESSIQVESVVDEALKGSRR